MCLEAEQASGGDGGEKADHGGKEFAFGDMSVGSRSVEEVDIMCEQEEKQINRRVSIPGSTIWTFRLVKLVVLSHWFLEEFSRWLCWYQCWTDQHLYSRVLYLATFRCVLARVSSGKNRL